MTNSMMISTDKKQSSIVAMVSYCKSFSKQCWRAFLVFLCFSLPDHKVCNVHNGYQRPRIGTTISIYWYAYISRFPVELCKSIKTPKKKKTIYHLNIYLVSMDVRESPAFNTILYGLSANFQTLTDLETTYTVHYSALCIIFQFLPFTSNSNFGFLQIDASKNIAIIPIKNAKLNLCASLFLVEWIQPYSKRIRLWSLHYNLALF